jgi:regulator of replication initiation timing
MNAYTGESDDAAKVASLEEQMKTLQDHVEYLLSRNVNAEKETDKLREELLRSANSHISR